MLIWASIRMTVQLILAGFILTYIFKNPHPAFVIIYLFSMIFFCIKRVLSKTPHINTNFKTIISISIALPGLLIIIYFLQIIIGVNIFNPQYMIPISGMIFVNSMTGVSLGLDTFHSSLKSQKLKTEVLLNLGAAPKKILLPYVNNALETALLPTLNSMLGWGLFHCPE